MTPQNNPNNQARWVGSSFEHVNALFSPVQTIVDNNGASKTTADTENNLKKLEDKSEIHKLKPDKIANELDQLQTDLKLLADAFARSKHLGKTEADKSLSAFFSKLRYNAEHFDALTVPDSNTVEDQTAYSAYKAMPHYTAVLSAASLLLKHETKDNPSLHPEEIYSIAKAKEQIYKLRSELAEKKEENVRLLNSIKEMNLDSSVLLPTSKSSLSTSYFPLAISDLVTRLQNTYSSNTFGIQSPQETVLDDPSAYLHACSGWMLSQQTYDFFISYRVATDAKIAMELYFRLQTQRICDEHGNFRNIRVYWDKECLENGQNWHDGFIEGLKNSRCILMLVSKGAIERMSTSDTQTDNVLLEWETAILAGQAKICIPQPIFIDDPKNKITGYDFLRSFLDSEKCPKFRPNTIGAHRQSAYTTLTALINLQGIHLKMEEVSWAIPACMTAVTNYDSIKAAAVAKQCHTESSFFNYFPKIEIDCLDYEIEFLSSNDLKELFGSEEEQKEGILKYNKQLENLKLIFRGNPIISHHSMRILCKGLTQNYSFFSKLDLKNCRMNEGTIWIQFAAALKENTHLKVLNLSGNDIRDAPQLLHVIQNHKSLDFVRIGAEFDPLPFLQNKSSPKVTFDTVDSLGLDLFVEVCEIGKAKLNEIHIDEFKVDPNDDEKKFEDAVLKLGNYLSTLPALFEISLPDVLIDVATNCLNTSNSIITVHLGKLNPGKKKSVERHVYKTKQVFQGFELFCSALTIRSDSKTPYVLETIDLTNLSLTDEDMLIFGEAMKKTAVKNLILRNNGITSAGISQVLNSFSRKDLLKRIDFSSNLIGPFSFEAFLDFLKAATGLQELRLSENSIGKTSGALIACMKPESFLRVLDLQRTNMTDNDLINISKALKLNKSITDLNLADADFTDEGLKELGNSLSKNSTLKKLFLDYSLKESEGLRHIADAFKTGECAIEHLSLNKCNLKDSGAKMIFESQISRKKIRTLSLNENEIKGELELDKFFQNNKDYFFGGIEKLWLERNASISKKFVNTLTQVGFHQKSKETDELNQGLKLLSLSRCTEIGQDFASHIIESLGSLGSIELLLDDCELDDKIVESICDAIVHPKASFTLSLENNKITEDGLKTLVSFTSDNLNIGSLKFKVELHGNSISNKYLDELYDELARYNIYIKQQSLV